MLKIKNDALYELLKEKNQIKKEKEEIIIVHHKSEPHGSRVEIKLDYTTQNLKKFYVHLLSIWFPNYIDINEKLSEQDKKIEIIKYIQKQKYHVVAYYAPDKSIHTTDLLTRSIQDLIKLNINVFDFDLIDTIEDEKIKIGYYLNNSQNYSSYFMDDYYVIVHPKLGFYNPNGWQDDQFKAKLFLKEEIDVEKIPRDTQAYKFSDVFTYSKKEIIEFAEKIAKLNNIIDPKFQDVSIQDIKNLDLTDLQTIVSDDSSINKTFFLTNKRIFIGIKKFEGNQRNPELRARIESRPRYLKEDN